MNIPFLCGNKQTAREAQFVLFEDSSLCWAQKRGHCCQTQQKYILIRGSWLHYPHRLVNHIIYALYWGSKFLDYFLERFIPPLWYDEVWITNISWLVMRNTLEENVSLHLYDEQWCFFSQIAIVHCISYALVSLEIL